MTSRRDQLKQALKETFLQSLTEGSFKYTVHGRDNEHISTHDDSGAAIRAANRAEDKSGYVHRVHKISAKPEKENDTHAQHKVHNTWIFKDSHQAYAKDGPHVDHVTIKKS